MDRTLWTRIRKPLVFWVSIIALGAFVFSLWHWLPGYLTRSHSSIITRGAYGDTYGSVTALFTGFAFAGLIVTIFLQTRELKEQRKELKAQRKELTLQRKELKSNRVELKGQKEQLANQSETLQLQRFENTFFELQRVHIDIVAKTEFRSRRLRFHNSRDHTWRERFGHGVSVGIELLSQAQRTSGQSKAVFVAEILNSALEDDHRLRDCLRHFFQIIEFVDTSDIPNKQRYVNFLEVHLDLSALEMIFYSSLTTYGQEYKPLIEKYGLLAHLKHTDPFIDWCRRDLISESAFQEKR